MKVRGVFPLSWVWTLALALLVAACAPAPAEAPRPAGAPEPARPAAIQRGGVFVQAVPAPFTNCHAHQASERSTNITLDHVYEPLVRFDYNVKDYRADLPLLPWLAERWEQPNPTTYLFHLRKGVKWHDGKAFTADDVVATVELIRKNRWRVAGTWRPFKTIEKVDDYTLRLVTEGPSPMALAGLAQPSEGFIYPKHVIEAGTLETACIGTGPFVMKSVSPTSKAVQERYPDYWRRDEAGNPQPYLNGLQIIYNMDRSAMQGAFAAQELDLLPLTTFPEVEAFTKQVPEAQVLSFFAHHSHGLLINTTRKPFDDPRVRRAVNLLIDRQQIVETPFFGKGLISLPVVPAIKEGWGLSAEETLKLPGYRKDKTADVAEAKKLLAEAGLPEGFTFELLYIKTWAVAPMGEFVPSLLKPYGITVKLRGVDSASATKERQEGNFDTLLHQLANFDPLLRTDETVYSKSALAKVMGIKDIGQDAPTDELRVTLDFNRQKELVRRIQQLVLDNAWSIPLADPAFFNAVQPWVKGYRSTFSAQPDPSASAWQIWFDQGKLPAKRKG